MQKHAELCTLEPLPAAAPWSVLEAAALGAAAAPAPRSEPVLPRGPGRAERRACSGPHRAHRAPRSPRPPTPLWAAPTPRGRHPCGHRPKIPPQKYLLGRSQPCARVRRGRSLSTCALWVQERARALQVGRWSPGEGKKAVCQVPERMNLNFCMEISNYRKIACILAGEGLRDPLV